MWVSPHDGSVSHDFAHVHMPIILTFTLCFILETLPWTLESGAGHGMRLDQLACTKFPGLQPLQVKRQGDVWVSPHSGSVAHVGYLTPDSIPDFSQKMTSARDPQKVPSMV